MTTARPPVLIGDHALLTNHGDHWTLRVETGGWITDDTFRNADLAEDESPRDAAVKRITDLGWRVVGDGAWWVGAWVGPAAAHAWAYLEPVTATNGDTR